MLSEIAKIVVRSCCWCCLFCWLSKIGNLITAQRKHTHLHKVAPILLDPLQSLFINFLLVFAMKENVCVNVHMSIRYFKVTKKYDILSFRKNEIYFVQHTYTYILPMYVSQLINT